ncbi:MAG: hypothetical protein ACRC7B_00185 [Metamycoplasmataceae bacterium]
MSTKKILLGFGASLLTISPIALMVACSSSEDKIEEKIEVQANKFKPTTTTKSEMTSQEAVSSIVDASNPDAKRAALLEFATVPKLDTGFDYVVLSASIDNQVKSTVNVDIKVYEISNENNFKNVKFIVKEFVEPTSNPELAPEVSKFNKQVNTKRTDLTSIQAMEMINGKTPEETLAALETLADVPTLSEGFEFSITGATINLTTSTTIDVAITVSQITTDDTGNAIFRVAGFKFESNIDTESEKFNKQVNTKRTDLTSIQATAMIDGKNPIEALASLEILADIPTLAVGFEFIVTGATINTTTNTTIDVAITVSKTGTSDNRNVIFRVAGFTPGSSLDTEAAKFNIIVTTKTPETISEVAAQSIQNASSSAGKLAALEGFVNSADIPTLKAEFDFVILSAQVDAQVNKTVNVMVRVFEEANPTNMKEVVFKVAGLTTRLETQVRLFNTSVLTRTPTLASEIAAQRIQNAANSALKYSALLTFVDSTSIPTLNTEFDFEVLSAQVDGQLNTTVNVKIKVFQKSNIANFEEATFKVTGLTTRLEMQVDKFTRVLSQGTNNAGIKALRVAQIIDLAPASNRVQEYNRYTYSDFPNASDGFRFEILSALVNPAAASRVNVRVRIFEISKPENNKIINLLITDFHNLSALEVESLKFTETKRTKSTIWTAAAARDRINGEATPEGKKAFLRPIVEMPVLGGKFDYEVIGARISDRDPNELYVTIRVLESNNTGVPWSFDVTFPVNGFIPA